MNQEAVQKILDNSKIQNIDTESKIKKMLGE